MESYPPFKSSSPGTSSAEVSLAIFYFRIRPRLDIITLSVRPRCLTYFHVLRGREGAWGERKVEGGRVSEREWEREREKELWLKRGRELEREGEVRVEGERCMKDGLVNECVHSCVHVCVGLHKQYP